MKKLLTILIFLLIAIWVGFLIHQDSGYVLVGYGGYTIETSIWVALCLLVITFFVVSGFFWLLKRFTRFNQVLHAWGSQRKKHQALNQLHHGLCDIAAGDWPKAEKKLTQSTEYSPMPLINYLAAAYAAQERNHIEKRDEYLLKATQASPQSDIAIGLTQATLQAQNQQWEQTYATLKNLHTNHPQQKTILKRLAMTLKKMAAWQEIIDLLPQLKRTQSLTSQALEAIKIEAYYGLIQHAAQHSDLARLHQCWAQLPRNLRENDALLFAYTAALIKNHDKDEAANIIVMSLRKRWRVTLLDLYANAITKDINQQIMTAENWLHQHPGEPELLTCLGKLYMNAKRFEQAEQCLRDAIHNAPTPQRYQLLGETMDALDRPQEAIDAYRKALTL